MDCTTFLLLLSSVWAATGGDNLIHREWSVEGATREALVYAPAAAKTQSSPVVFAFHGHGGSIRNVAQKYAYQKHWPEAIVVYMQGLNTPGQLTDPEGKKPGWQKGPGDQNDRDLKFFDAVLATLNKEYRVDAKRIYATGHSNGGGFTYLLWSARDSVFAAVAPCASASRLALGKLKPKPVFHLAGEKDPLVRFEWQTATIGAVRKLNGCEDGQPWAEHCTLYPSKSGTPMVTYIHGGGHEFPAAAPPLIVRFFKEYSRP